MLFGEVWAAFYVVLATVLVISANVFYFKDGPSAVTALKAGGKALGLLAVSFGLSLLLYYGSQ
jgi:hypothetical protein